MNIPVGSDKESIKAREKIIKDFYAHWIAENPSKRIWNEHLQDYILVKFISINETYNKAARRYESTLAVLSILYQQCAGLKIKSHRNAVASMVGARNGKLP